MVIRIPGRCVVPVLQPTLSGDSQRQSCGSDGRELVNRQGTRRGEVTLITGLSQTWSRGCHLAAVGLVLKREEISWDGMKDIYLTQDLTLGWGLRISTSNRLPEEVGPSPVFWGM